MTTIPRLGRKQRSNHADWLVQRDRIATLVSHDEIASKTAAAAQRVLTLSRGRRVAFGWSGGKDSLALQLVMREAGVEDCVLVLTDLEYPAFLKWVTRHMPPKLTVLSTGQDLDWLAAHPDMLFPKNASIAGKWFSIVQHTGQRRYVKDEQVDVLCLGRRRADGNVVRDGLFTNAHGVTIATPIADWSHEDVLAALHYAGVELPPTYGWPRGFQVGTGPWPARQWCRDEAQGWYEVYCIDPTVVAGAASRFPGAARELEAH